ncbi:helix-turn-helix transcriptional regulator [Aneurinibacillus uraniidurans]|uniref:helix-turn-helix transcriptional regulator n=1 Tax=Aneurinibacillus uraniidurans TaxID=2966586 RepID=UPI00234A96EF|nr:metalloregulator ArsR/SmtB family transcription factor [Aneurinibacillus sp. B1]WCN38400.1 transcriptional regulator [Aneurinibacillus sp. B1]
MNKDKSSSTRNQILHMLKIKGSMTVGEMAQELEITEMAVRRHLNTLERDKYIQTRLLRQAMGRPTNVYSLSQEADNMFPKNYQDLTLEILGDIEELQGAEMVEALFRLRQQRQESLYRDVVPEGSDFEKKLEMLARMQNEKGYMVEVKKDEETGRYILVESNCPIFDVAREYTFACNCEKTLFENILETRVEQEQCMATGGDNCVYVIDHKNDTAENRKS